MKVGLVGFAGSDKTAVFNALTGLAAEVGYGSRDRANIGVIKVPDERVDKLSAIFKPKKTVYAEISFVDVAGPDAESVDKTHTGLDPKLVQHMRDTEALAHVVRAFDSAFSTPSPDPARDIAAFDDELILTDLVQVENRIARVKKEKDSGRERDVMERLKSALESEKPIRDLDLTSEEESLITGFRFLSQKPLLLLLNVSENNVASGPSPELISLAASRGLDLIAMCGKAEMEIAELPPDEQRDFLADLGISEPARDRFIRAGYHLLDLISFMTVGEDECRAWPIMRGTTAHKAAG